MGTAESGPLNQPVALTSLSHAKEVFGAYGNGTLIRGIFEAFGANAVNKDVRGCRVGNAKKASLGFPESSLLGSATVSYDDATLESDGLTQIPDALVITALKEGDEFNDVSVRFDYINGQLSVVIFNPETALESSFTYDSDVNAIADVHTVDELENAINADPNLNTVVVAEMKDLAIKFEVDLMGPVAPAGSGTYPLSSGVTIEGENARVILRERLDPIVVGADGLGLPSGVFNIEDLYGNLDANFPTVGDKILSLDSVYQIAIVPDTSGTTGELLLESKGRSTIQLTETPIKGVGSEKTLIALDGIDATVSEGKASVFNGFIAIVESTGTLTYAWETLTGVDIDAATFGLSKTVGTVKSLVAAADYTLTGAGPTPDVTFTAGLVPGVGTILTVDYLSDIFTFTEVATRTAVQATEDPLQYFISGNTLYFGAASPTHVIITYKYKKQFGLNGEVILENATRGQILWPATDASPKDDLEAAAINAPPVRIGFEYTYQPEWISLGFSAVGLKGGSDGIIMTVAEKYDALSDAFDNMENYDADIFAPMNCYLDETKEIHNAETGDLEIQNAGFHNLLHTFLSKLADGVNEAIGIISVKPATGNTLSAVNDWFKKLTAVSTTDLTRGANIMAAFDSKFVSTVAMEPLFINNEVSVPYTATGEATYSGLISTLQPQSSTTNKRIDRVVGLRYPLSNTQLNTLSEKRYVTLRRGGTPPGIVVTDGVTAAATGSDYVRLSTVRIVFAAMDVVREVAEPFIGEPNDAAERQALETAITRGLQKMTEARALRDFAFTVKSTPAEQVQGIVNVEMILVPAFEMRKIQVTVKLRPSL